MDVTFGLLSYDFMAASEALRLMFWWDLYAVHVCDQRLALGTTVARATRSHSRAVR